MGATAPPARPVADEIRAKRVVLVDGAGYPRARLGVDPDGEWRLALADSAGEVLFTAP